jgi:hypothetical protein
MRQTFCVIYLYIFFISAFSLDNEILIRCHGHICIGRIYSRWCQKKLEIHCRLEEDHEVLWFPQAKCPIGVNTSDQHQGGDT